MKVTMRGGDFRSAVGWVARLCPGNPAVPVVGGILIDASEKLTLTAFDFETAGVVTAAADAPEPGLCLTSGRLLGAVAKVLRESDAVDLVADDRSLRIAAGTSSWSLPLMDVEDFPQVSSPGAVLGEVDAATLRSALEVVSPAAGGPKCSVPELVGTVRLTSSADGLALAATDKYRMSYAEVNWAPSLDDDLVDLVAPADLIKTALAGVSGQVTLRTEGGTFTIQTSDRLVTGRLVDGGKFPAMKVLLDKMLVEVATAVAVDVAEMVHAVKSATAVQGDIGILTLDLRQDGGSVYGMGTGTGTTPDSAAFSLISFHGEPTTVGVNAGYLLDGLAGCGDRAVLSLPMSPSRPFLIQPATSEGLPAGSHRYLLMTVKVAS